MYRIATHNLINLVSTNFGNISDDQFVEADMGIDGKRVIDKTYRITQKTTCDVAWPIECVGKEKLALLLKDANIKPSVSFSNFEILKYTVGSFFDKHTDTMHHSTHIGTLLAVFPSEDLEGGDLIMEPADGEKIIISKIVPYLTFIPLGTIHSVSVIKKGFRIVAKAAVLMNEPKKVKQPSRRRIRKVLQSGHKD
jgi:hypothetical protein